MMFQSDPYAMLMASLPAVGFLSEKAPAISRTRLSERLKALAPEDKQELDDINSLLSWNRIDASDDDEAFVARAEKILAAVRTTDLRDAVRDRLENRTLLAALRRRRDGQEAPPRGVRWGVGRYVEQIRSHWAQPDMGVGHVFPWVDQARQLLDAGDAAGLERLTLERAWAAESRRELNHAFDFEAVAFYTLRWTLADRWARYDADGAAKRFSELLEKAFADVPETLEAA